MLRTLRSWLGGSNTPPVRKRPGTMLSMEGLETREVPAVATVYTNDFSAPGAFGEWSAYKQTAPPADKARFFLGEFSNDAVTLTLPQKPLDGSPAPALQAHDALVISFDLLILKSWDGSDPSKTYGPDRFVVSVDGKEVFNNTFSNQPAASPGAQNNVQSFGGKDGKLAGAFTGASEFNSLGYEFYRGSAKRNEKMDSVYKITLVVPHTAAGAKITFQGKGLQGVKDESWGLDNVRVATANKADLAGPVTITPKTVGDLVAQIKAINPAGAAALLDKLEDQFNFDPTKDFQLEKTSYAGAWKTAKPDEFRIFFITNVLFSIDKTGDTAGSFIQTISGAETYLKDGKVVKQKAGQFVEGWDEVGKKAKALDTHARSAEDEPISFAAADTYVFEAAAVVGYGLFDGQKMVTNAASGYVKQEGEKSVQKVTWLGPTTTYKIRYELKKDGSWTFTDEAAKISRTGKAQ